MTKRKHGEDIRAAAALAVEATKRVTAIVEAMHREIASGPAWLGQPLAVPTRLLTALVYGNVRNTTGIVGKVIDKAVALLEPVLGESTPLEQMEMIRAALNGLLGSYLAETDNALAIPLTFRIEKPKKRMLLLVHGSSMNDRGWRRRGHDHGHVLSETLDLGLMYVSYNSGLHVSQNGALLATALASVETEELFIVAHSMGGLVVRSACLIGETMRWKKAVQSVVTLGTPHHGASLERVGAVLHTVIRLSRYSAPLADLARIRGPGITDLRFGIVREQDWKDRDPYELGGDPRTPTPLPEGIDWYAVAGTKDGLVSLDSALGRHKDPALQLHFKETFVAETTHLGLLDDQDVAARMKNWWR